MSSAAPFILGALAFAQNPAWPLADHDAPADALASRAAMPDDPEFVLEEVDGACRGAFALFSFVPECAAALDPNERALGTGTSVDRAWLLTTGRPEVKVAILDTGVRWSDREVVGRIALNPGELPAPDLGPGSSGLHDANGDGAFDARDFTSATGTVAPTIDRVRDVRLAARPDRGDANGNGLLDPEDLIEIFGDGIDDDADGYVDDIAGWDFIDDDPDAGEEEGQASPLFDVALATANDGIGGAGVCPRCSGLPIRVTADGAALGNETAAAIAYAVDLGARVVLAPATIAGGSKSLAAAVGYATEHGVAVIAGAGSGSTRHAEAAWPADQVIIVGAIGFDRARAEDATTAWATDPCASSGAHVALRAPGRCDGTEAAVAAGIAGLVSSASLGIPAQNVPPLVPPLSARELRGVMLEAGDDRAGPDETRGTRPRSIREVSIDPPARRINARRAVEAVLRRRIPPVATFVAPGPGALIDPTPLEGVKVRADLESARSKRLSWVLEWARGRNPPASSFAPVASGTTAPGLGETAAGTLSIASIFADPTAPPTSSSGEAEVTLRLVATAESGGEVTRSEIRRAIFVNRDLELLPDFPVALPAGTFGGPRTVDLDGDGNEEVVVATDDGRVHAVSARGVEVEGFPRETPRWSFADPTAPGSHASAAGLGAPMLAGALNAGVLSTLAGGVLGDRPSRTLVVTTLDGTLLAFDTERRDPMRTGPSAVAMTGLPTRRALGAARSPAIEDLDGDGLREVIATTADGRVAVFDAGLSPVSGFPVDLGEAVGSPAVGDLDRDGSVDIVVASSTRVYALHGDGSAHAGGALLPGFPVSVTPAVAPSPRGLEAVTLPAPALADVQGDGALEIVLAVRGLSAIVVSAGGAVQDTTELDRASFGGGSDLGREGPRLEGLGGALALGDLDGDGRPDAACVAARAQRLARLDPEDIPEPALALASLSTTRLLSGAPRALAGIPVGSAAILDVDGDGRPEVLFDGGDGILDAVNFEGTRPRLWPKLIGDALAGAPALGDLDGDGLLEVVAVTVHGNIFAWRTRAGRTTAQWAGVQHDDRGTGNLETRDFEAAARVSSSCRDMGSGDGAAWLLVLGLPILGSRLRRRGRREHAC